MLRTPSLTIRAAAGALLLGTALSSAHAAATQTRVGVNVAVNPDAVGADPGAAPRRMVIGQPVVYEEHVATDRAGQTQIVFLDQSMMSVGPNSDLVVDRFIYDPQRNTGELAMSATRGVFRYIGGRLSKLEGRVSLKTPTAAVGIRGGVFLMELGDNGRLAAIFVYGVGLRVTAGGRTEIASRPGFEITVAGPGLPPSAPFRADPRTIARLLALLDGQPGKNAGASTVPTDAMVTTTPLYAALAQTPGTAPTPPAAASACPTGQQPPVYVACRQIAFQPPIPQRPIEPTPLPRVNQVVQIAPSPPPSPVLTGITGVGGAGRLPGLR
ncbi:MAG TPA: hypothetical protein VGR91_11520 [Stellaceae bacterium]|nr:hypothetical protein [Stellaceae bacterium]